MVCLLTYNYRGYPDALERTFKKGREYGYDGIEVFFRQYDIGHLEEELKKMRQLSKRYSLPIAAIYCGANILAEDESERRKDIERIKKAIPLFKDFGIKVVNTIQGLPTSPTAAEKRHYYLASEAYKEIGSVAEEEGIKIVLETHPGGLTETITSSLRLFEMIDSPAVKLNLDPANLYPTISPRGFPVTLAQKTLEEAVELLKDYIGHVHLKTCKLIGSEYSSSWPLEEGDIDYYKIFLQLKKIDFKGIMAIEYVGEGDPNPRVEKDIKYVKNILKELDMAQNS